MSELSRLSQEVQKRLKEGKKIVIYGWLPKNHTKETQELQGTKLVRFVEQNARTSGVAGYVFVLMTEYIDHKDSDKIKKRSIPHYPHTLSIKRIRNILQACASTIYTLAEARKTDTGGLAQPEEDEESTLDNLVELEQHILKTEVYMDQYDKLAERFKTVSSARPGGLVSTQELGKVLKELDFPKSARQTLRRNEWIIPVSLEHKQKAGWYRAGERLLKRIQKGRQEEPVDTAKKMEWLIENKESFIKELEEAKRKREEVMKREDELVEEKAIMVRRAESAEKIKKEIDML